jgi:hypothetical protein
VRVPQLQLSRRVRSRQNSMADFRNGKTQKLFYSYIVK